MVRRQGPPWGLPLANREPALCEDGGREVGARKNHSLRESPNAAVQVLPMSECTAKD